MNIVSLSFWIWAPKIRRQRSRGESYNYQGKEIYVDVPSEILLPICSENTSIRGIHSMAFLLWRGVHPLNSIFGHPQTASSSLVLSSCCAIWTLFWCALQYKLTCFLTYKQLVYSLALQVGYRQQRSYHARSFSTCHVNPDMAIPPEAKSVWRCMERRRKKTNRKNGSQGNHFRQLSY